MKNRLRRRTVVALVMLSMTFAGTTALFTQPAQALPMENANAAVACESILGLLTICNGECTNPLYPRCTLFVSLQGPDWYPLYCKCIGFASVP